MSRRSPGATTGGGRDRQAHTAPPVRAPTMVHRRWPILQAEWATHETPPRVTARLRAAARSGRGGPGGPCSLALAYPLRQRLVASFVPLFVPPQGGAAALGARGGLVGVGPASLPGGRGRRRGPAAIPSVVFGWFCSAVPYVGVRHSRPGSPYEIQWGAGMPPTSAAAGCPLRRGWAAAARGCPLGAGGPGGPCSLAALMGVRGVVVGRAPRAVGPPDGRIAGQVWPLCAQRVPPPPRGARPS